MMQRVKQVPIKTIAGMNDNTVIRTSVCTFSE